MPKKPTYEELEKRVQELEQGESERKLTDEALRESEKRFRDLSDSLPQIVFETDEKDTLTYTNRNAFEYFGYAESEFDKKLNALQMLIPEDRDRAVENIQEVLNGEILGGVEYTALRKDGSTFPIEIHSNAFFRDNKPIGLRGIIIDLRDSKQAEKMLRKERGKAQQYLDIAGAIIVVFNTDQTVAVINKKGCEILGNEAPKIIGKNWFDHFLPEKDKDKARETFSELVEGRVEPVEYFENYVLTKDNKEKLIAWHNSVLRDDEEKIITILSSGEDITDRKRMEEALRESEEKYRLITETSQTGIFIHQDDIIMYANDKFAELHGYKADELIGTNYFNLFQPDERERVLGIKTKRLRGDEDAPQYHETKRVKKDGGILWCQTVAVRIEYQGKPAILGNITDITDRIQAEKSLIKSEAFKNTIIESSLDCIKLLDLEGNLKYMSKGGQERLEIKDIKVYLNKSWIDFWKGKDIINARMAFDTAVKVGIGKFRGYSPTETGIPRWWDVIITPLWDSNGEFEQLLAVSRDITEQKQMEEDLRQSQKIESIGTLTGGIAHDFNNILGVIVGNTELALDDVPEWNPAHSCLEKIKTASIRATNIVRQLLSFSRKTKQKLYPIEIALVIKDALKFLRSTIPTTIDIQQDIQATDETILADPTQINQIMMNLCINASQAMEQTGGNLTVNVEKVILDDNSAKDYPDLRSGRHVKVTVSDTGPGIDPKIIDRIFDPYFTTKEVGKGSGMGLAVVQGIVKNHGGAILVDTRRGEGTTFSILFPLAEGRAEIETETTQELPTGSETILFVDDEISIIKMVKKIFELLGYKVEASVTPQDALERFRLNPEHFDLVITDMTMPQMTGVKLSEKLMDIRPDIPVIICTGHSSLIDEERAKQLGISAYVMKPINMPEIAQTIRKVLDK